MTTILVPVSGGKDSTACLVAARRGNPDHEVIAVFNDTGWEHPIVYEYLQYLGSVLGIEVHKTKGGRRRDGSSVETLVDTIRSVGRFPFGRGRFCTMYLKQYALRDWYKDNCHTTGSMYEFWYGIRTQESHQRARKYDGIGASDLFDMDDLYPNRYNNDLRSKIKVRFPIISWSTEEVFKYLEENGIDKNPLYDEGTNDRVGCYPCLLAGKKIQKAMFETEFGQQQLKIIKELELELGQKYEMYDTEIAPCLTCSI